MIPGTVEGLKRMKGKGKTIQSKRGGEYMWRVAFDTKVGQQVQKQREKNYMSQSCQKIREARMKGKGTQGESIREIGRA